MSKTTERAATVWPTLRYRDARAAIRFLVDAFGFEEILGCPGDRTTRSSPIRSCAGRPEAA